MQAGRLIDLLVSLGYLTDAGVKPSPQAGRAKEYLPTQKLLDLVRATAPPPPAKAEAAGFAGGQDHYRQLHHAVCKVMGIHKGAELPARVAGRLLKLDPRMSPEDVFRAVKKATEFDRQQWHYGTKRPTARWLVRNVRAAG